MPIRPEIDERILPLGGEWFLAEIDADADQPQEGEYGYGTYNATLLVPADDWITTRDFVKFTGKRFKYCQVWTTTPVQIQECQRVWVMEYFGVNLIVLADPEDA